MLLSSRDPVEGIFEIRGQDGDAISTIDRFTGASPVRASR